MAEAGDLLGRTLRSADARALPALYAAVSARTGATRAWLRRRGLPFLDPDVTPAPRLADVDRTADHVIAQTRANAAALGVFGGVAGWLSAPPEAVAWIVACLRLAQRLAVVYGFDPATDRGHAAVTRAIAAGFQVDIPESGLVALRVSDVARLASARAPGAGAIGTTLARAVVARSVRLVAGRVGRLLPVVASGVSAVGNHEEAAAVGHRMKATLRQLAEGPAPDAGRVFEAVEVVPARR